MKAKILVPDTLEDITLGQYQKFIKISEENKDSLFLNQKMVQIFCDLELKEVMNIKYKSLEKIVLHLSKLFEEKPKFKCSFLKGNKTFSFIPNLEEITFGEYVDLDSTLKDWDSMHFAMGVLFRPQVSTHKNKYLIEPYQYYDKYDMKEMPLDVALGAMVFFYHLGMALLKDIPNSFSKEMENLTSQQKQTLTENGDIITQFTALVREALPDLMKLPNSLSINA
tara:strand:- start:7637 stop:8308 length:672 start_codon:yes stop_codon:yes gene_type:complete